MALSNAPLVALNRGEVSPLALARVDLERLRLSAEEQVNWLPRTLGPMTLRPGLRYCANTRGDGECRVLPFVFATFDTAAVEITDGWVRVLLDDAPITRESVNTIVANGNFTLATGWASTVTGSAVVTLAGDAKLKLVSPARGGRAVATNTLTIANDDQGKEHALRVIVDRGPVTFYVGTTAGDDDLVERASLDQGIHSLAFTAPLGDPQLFIQFETTSQRPCQVSGCQVEAPGTMEIPCPWGVDDLPYLRYEQSGDVLFVCDGAHQQRRIERHGPRSWSVSLYKTNDGPFKATVTTPDVTITPSGTSGDITLTASAPLWGLKSVGQLYRLLSTSQKFSNGIGALNAVTNAVRIFGVEASRQFTVTITGTWAGTLSLQRSFDGADVGFQTVTGTGAQSWTANATTTIPTDGFDNQAVWYRVIYSTYTSGAATVELSYPGGGGAGIVRITGYTDTTHVAAEVLTDLKSTVATSDWREGEWSDEAGWPSAVCIYDGRMWWAGKDREWGSVSDAYDSWSLDQVGDAGCIQRSIGTGPVDYISWLLPLQRLLVGTGAAEISVRSSSFDEPLTPTNFGQKAASTQGSAPVAAVKMDGRGIFLQRSEQRIYELSYDLNAQDYRAKDLTQLRPDIAGNDDAAGIKGLAIQRQPDTRIHAIRSDGQVGMLTYEPDEEVICWWRIESPACGGIIEAVYVLPGAIEDRVYYVIKRTINGTVRRFHERQAREGQCWGLAEARLSDAHVLQSNTTPFTVVTGLAHIEGQSVVAWGWNTADEAGKDLGTYTVTGGQVTLSQAVQNACVGLTYQARFKSAKLAYGGALGTAINQRKKLGAVGLVLSKTHAQGVKFGGSYTTLSPLPLYEAGRAVDPDKVWDEYDADMMSCAGEWSTDSRLCITASSPRPATVLGAVVQLETHDRT